MMTNHNTQSLTGPFESKSDPGQYYVHRQDGTQHVLSTDLLFAGTATEVAMDDIDDSILAQDKAGAANFSTHAETKFNL